MRQSLLAATAMANVILTIQVTKAEPVVPVVAPPVSLSPTPGEGLRNKSAALETITVTATRRRENLQKAAISVTAISSARLEAAGVVEVSDLSKVAPGINISPNAAGSQIYLRGVGTFGIGAFTDSPVAFNVDGIFLGIPAETAGNFFDLARVEVLKGPQGTLYGKNATAGAINLISNPPVQQFGGYSTFEIGNYGLFKTTDAINLPLSDKLSVRAAAEFVNRDGYFSDGTGANKSVSVRLQALYKPTDDISLLIAGDYIHVSGGVSPSVAIPLVNPSNPWQGPSGAVGNAYINSIARKGLAAGGNLPSFFSKFLPDVDTNQYLHSDSAGIRGDLEWNLGFSTLSILASYRHFDSSNGNETGFPAPVQDIGHQSSVEIRLASPSDNGRLKWIAGLYYFNELSDSTVVVDQGFLTHTDKPDEGDTAVAAFGEATYTVLPHFRVTGGLRGTTETRTQSGFGLNVYSTDAIAAFRQATGIPSFVPVLEPLRYNYTNAATFRDISVKAGLEYDVAPNSLAFATFSTGYKTGGLNPDVNTSKVSNVYQPEKLIAYTIGSKNRFLGGALQANAEAFYWNYKNHQEIYLTATQATANEPPAAGFSQPLTHNIGASTIKGFDLDLQYKLTQSDLLSAQVEYLDAVFNVFRYLSPSAPNTSCPYSFQTSSQQYLVNCDGKPFTRAPKWSATLGYQHIFALQGNRGDIVTAINTQISTSYGTAVDFLPLERQAAYTITDFNLTYEPPSGIYTITGYVHNIEDSVVIDSSFAYPFANSFVYANIRPPRTFGGILKVRF